MIVDRRTLLIGGGVGVGLIVALAAWPDRLDSDLPVSSDQYSFGHFIKVGRDDRVTVAVPQTETGQGIWTALPQIVADELGADWEKVGVEPAPLSGSYANRLATDDGWLDDLGALRSFQIGDDALRITAGSTSVRAFAQPIRTAAAIARTMLVGAAADRWNVDPEACAAVNGTVVHNGQSFTFGELAEEAASRSPPRSPQLREGRASRLAGRALPRLDGPAKCSGAQRYAGDVRLPGLLFASARLAPRGGSLQSYSGGAARRFPGVREIVAKSDWLAVVADNHWAAEQAITAMAPSFSGPASPTDLRPLFEDAISAGTGEQWVAHGDYAGLAQASRGVAATYYVAPSQHLGLEPITATARVTGDRTEVWAATQAPGFAAREGSLYPMPAGEPAGRALEGDAAPIAAAIARDLNRPIQVTLSQSASQNHDRPAPGALARMTAIPDPAGVVAGWRMRVATANGLGSAMARLSGSEPPGALGRTALEGTVPPYSFPNVLIETILANLPITAGYMRGSPQREFCFFNESFIDELARRANQEPLAYRMAMLSGNGRLARCFQAVSGIAQWDGGGPGSTMGLAGCSAFGSHIALIATASIGEDQRIKLHKLVAAVDCGQVVNEGLVVQQIEGGLMWAFAQATVPAPQWIAGLPVARPIGGIGLPRIADTPEIVVRVLQSREEPGGVSGLGTTVLAPAVANAIYAGSGKRLRTLPFDLTSAA